MKIVFMGTPDFAARQLREIANSYEVSLVVTQEDASRGRSKKKLPSPVKIVAEELGIEVFQPSNINSEESIKKLRDQDADLFIVSAYGQILKGEVLNIPKLYSVNIHASILPKYRGAAPINWAIIDGEKETGVSIMKMDVGLDTGDVALIKKIEINDKDAIELEEELSRLGAEAIIEFIESCEDDTVVFTPQENEKSSYAKKIDKTTGYIDFSNMSAIEIERLVRGLVDRSGASFVYKDMRVKLLGCSVISKNSEKSPGSILSNSREWTVQTREGIISIDRLQFPGKKAMDIKSFLLGNSIDETEVL